MDFTVTLEAAGPCARNWAGDAQRATSRWTQRRRRVPTMIDRSVPISAATDLNSRCHGFSLGVDGFGRMSPAMWSGHVADRAIPLLDLAVRMVRQSDGFDPSELVESLEQAQRRVRAGEIVEVTAKSVDRVASKVASSLRDAARRVETWSASPRKSPNGSQPCAHSILFGSAWISSSLDESRRIRADDTRPVH